jgi:predicted nuclease with TOPRIM domain
LKEESSAADDAITQWQASYTALEVRRLEMETQLETLTKEKEELLNVESSSINNAVDVEELRSEKDKLERMLQERDEALAAAREDLNQDAEVVQEWEGKLLECWTCFALTVDTIILTLAVFITQIKSQSLSQLSIAWKFSWKSSLERLTT